MVARERWRLKDTTRQPTILIEHNLWVLYWVITVLGRLIDVYAGNLVASTCHNVALCHWATTRDHTQCTAAKYVIDS